MLAFQVLGEHEDAVLLAKAVVGLCLEIRLPVVQQRNEHLTPADLRVPGHVPQTQRLVIKRHILIIQLNLRRYTQKFLYRDIDLTLDLNSH